MRLSMFFVMYVCMYVCMYINNNFCYVCLIDVCTIHITFLFVYVCMYVCMYVCIVFLYARTLETSGSSGLKFKSAGVYRSMHPICKARRIADAHTQRFIDSKTWVEVCMYV